MWSAAPKIKRDDKGKQQEFIEKKKRKELSREGLCRKEIRRGEGLFSK
jgi:hypothetical protein